MHTDVRLESISRDFIVTYLECGMYLIAACLPSLRVVFVDLYKLLSGSIGTLLKRYRTQQFEEIKSTRPGKVSIELTGIGKLNTLVREGQQIGISATQRDLEYGQESQPLDTDAVVPRRVHDGSKFQMPPGPICSVCHANKYPPRDIVSS